jgi:hypothetical protein
LRNVAFGMAEGASARYRDLLGTPPRAEIAIDVDQGAASYLDRCKIDNLTGWTKNFASNILDAGAWKHANGCVNWRAPNCPAGAQDCRSGQRMKSRFRHAIDAAGCLDRSIAPSAEGADRAVP